MTAKRVPPPEVTLTLGPPIVPAGLALQVTVPMTHMEGMLATLFEFIQQHEATWAQLPTSGPDTIHGGTPVSDADVLWDVSRRPRKLGF